MTCRPACDPRPDGGLDPKPLTNRLLLRRGLRRRCPLCGGGDVFETFFQVRERCPRCNFPSNARKGTGSAPSGSTRS